MHSCTCAHVGTVVAFLHDYLCSDVKHNLERMVCGFITLSSTISMFSNPNNLSCPVQMAKAVTQVSLIVKGNIFAWICSTILELWTLGGHLCMSVCACLCFCINQKVCMCCCIPNAYIVSPS